MNKPIPDDAGFFLDEYDSDKFWSRVNMHGGVSYLDDPLSRIDSSAGECWTWTGARTGNSRGWYGRIYLFGESVQAHDVGFREFGNRVPVGLILDHLCRNTLCVRHNHLEPVTIGENLNRGKSSASLRTACPHGHEFTEENTRWRQRGSKRSRECRTCIRAAKKRAA